MNPAPGNHVSAGIRMRVETWVHGQAEKVNSALEVMGDNLMFFHKIIEISPVFSG